MDRFVNKGIRGIHISRYISSWARTGRSAIDPAFKKWLYSLGLNKDEVDDIWFLANNGKFELECNAQDFVEKIDEEKESA